MKAFENSKINTIKKLVLKHNINLENSRFALNKNNEWLYFSNTMNDDRSSCEITMYTIINNVPIKSGFITYSIGKGFWKNRQMNLYKIEVDEKFRGHGLATYALSFLTEVAANFRIDTIDGNYYPSNSDAQIVYDKNGFKIEKEYYDTRIVKNFYENDVENIVHNTNNINGIKIYNNHRNLYIEKFRNSNKEDKVVKEMVK